MTPPTDFELMMFHDGELDDERASQVRSFLEKDAAARSKLSGLDLVGRAVREQARSAGEASADLTDLIMAKVRAEAPTKKEVLPKRDAHVPATPAAVSKSAPPPAAVTRVRELSSEAALPGAANDNGRLIFGLAAAAAAAAAALFIWGRSANPEDSFASRPTPPALTDTALVAQVESAQMPVMDAPLPQPSLAVAALAEDEEAPRSVTVDAVDFGSNAGTVIYMTDKDKATATTVVWVRDE